MVAFAKKDIVGNKFGKTIMNDIGTVNNLNEFAPYCRYQ